MVYKLLQADYQQNTQGRRFASWLAVNLFRLNGATWVIWFRLSNCRNTFIRLFSRLILKIISTIRCIDIPYTTQIDGGLALGHLMGVVINGGTIIGKNCHIAQFVNIGTNHKTPAVIGNNVYIGPMACIVEDVKIGNNVTIGAGSVVTHDIPDNATVAGVPAKILNYNNPARYIRKTDEK